MAMLPIDIQTVLAQAAEVSKIQQKIQDVPLVRQHVANDEAVLKEQLSDSQVHTAQESDNKDMVVKDREGKKQGGGENEKGRGDEVMTTADTTEQNPPLSSTAVKDPTKGTITDIKA